MSEEVRRKIHLHGLPPARPGELIHGHYALPSLVAAYPGAHLVTIMREPRCRLISHFLFWRGHLDSEMTGWGGWADRMKLARGRLEDFLEKRSLVSQLDNLFTRFLLCPHPGIPEDSCIAPELHDSLYDQALVKLRRFGLIDIVENSALEQNVARWLGREFHMEPRMSRPCGDFPVQLSDELTSDAVDRLRSLSAIDRRLWIHAAHGGYVPNPELLSDTIYATYVARQTSEDLLRAAMTPPSQRRSSPSTAIGCAATL